MHNPKNTIKKWLQLHIPIALTLFMLVTLQRTVDSDGGFDRVYGFPFAYITSNIGYSFHYEVYLLPLLADFTTYLILTYIIISLIQKTGFRFKSHNFFTIFGIFVTIALITFLVVSTGESDFYAIENRPYKIISKSVKVGVFP